MDVISILNDAAASIPTRGAIFHLRRFKEEYQDMMDQAGLVKEAMDHPVLVLHSDGSCKTAVILTITSFHNQTLQKRFPDGSGPISRMRRLNCIPVSPPSLPHPDTNLLLKLQSSTYCVMRSASYIKVEEVKRVPWQLIWPYWPAFKQPPPIPFKLEEDSMNTLGELLSANVKNMIPSTPSYEPSSAIIHPAPAASASQSGSSRPTLNGESTNKGLVQSNNPHEWLNATIIHHMRTQHNHGSSVAGVPQTNMLATTDNEDWVQVEHGPTISYGLSMAHIVYSRVLEVAANDWISLRLKQAFVALLPLLNKLGHACKKLPHLVWAILRYVRPLIGAALKSGALAFGALICNIPKALEYLERRATVMS